jgi:hypothetical protein
MAIEYGSSPEEQPALQMRVCTSSRSNSSGITVLSITEYVSQLRKNLVTLTVSDRINRSYSFGSVSSAVEYSLAVSVRLARIRTAIRLRKHLSL